jgi:hypothetical protein
MHRVQGGEEPLLRYYANSIAHLVPYTPADPPAGGA